MAIKFSGETKRSIWIVVAAGLAIALIGGTWAMLGEIFGWNSATPSSTSDSKVATPHGPVPAEVEEWFSSDLGTLGRPYPSGMEPPGLEVLLPQVKGSQLVSADSTSVTLEYPANYVDSEEDPDVMTYAVYRRGDVSVLEALYWRCDWAEEYVTATENNDEAARQTAREQLESFPEIEAVAGLPVAKNNEDELGPVLAGDSQSAKKWLADKCGR